MMGPWWVRRARQAGSLGIVVMLAVFTPIGGANAARAQAPPAEAGWVIGSSPQADLWFHGLAVIGYRGFAPLPMYSSEYARAMRQAKQQRGIYPTPLDTLAITLRTVFEADSTFEILHFVPLYFASADREGMLTAVRAALDGRSGRVTDASRAFGARVVQSVLRTREQRRWAERFVDALEAEWDRFLGEYVAERQTDRESALRAARYEWVQRVAPALKPSFDRVNLEGGVILVSPALGTEGRVFRADPNDSRDNVVAVSLPLDPADGGRAALAAVREFCFPAVSPVVEREGRAPDRVSGERTSSLLAVRCGGALLEARAPDLVPAYRRVFLSEDAAGGADREAFHRAFPVDERLLRMILAAMGAK